MFLLYEQAGDFVMEYCGEVVPVKEALQRAKAYETSGESIMYGKCCNVQGKSWRFEISCGVIF